MSERARMLRRNLAELLPNFDDHDLGVLVEAVADQIEARHRGHARALRAVAWWLTGVYVGPGGNLPPIYSGKCVPVREPGGPS